MEINVKAETERVQAEIAPLSNQLAQIDSQLNALQQQRNNIVAMILKKNGELELLQRLDGKKKLDEKDIKKVAEEVSKT